MSRSFPCRTDSLPNASLSRYATPFGILGRAPWRGFACSGAPDCRRRGGKSRSGDRPGRTLCRHRGRVRRPSQHLPRGHARRQRIRFGRFDVSVPSGTRYVHPLQPGAFRAICGKQTFPSAFWTYDTRRREKLLHVSVRRRARSIRLQEWECTPLGDAERAQSHGRPGRGPAPPSRWNRPIVT
jgi:hypothetical protein